MVVTSASYGLGAAVLKVCNELRPPEYSILREVADDPSLWGGVTLVGVITGESFATTVNLSIVQTLKYVHAYIFYERGFSCKNTTQLYFLIPVIIESNQEYCCSLIQWMCTE